MRRPPLVLTSGLAWLGVVAGHLAAYVLAYPSHPHRHLHLESSGHGWVDAATASVAAAVPVLVLSVVVRSLRSEAGWSGSGLTLRLLAIQVPAFALIETGERGGAVEAAFTDPAVLVGLLLQPVLALLARLGLKLVHRAVRAIVAGRVATTRRVRASLPHPAAERALSRAWLLLRARRRAPPVSLSF